MATIIPLYPNAQTQAQPAFQASAEHLNLLVKAAWQLTNSALWHEQTFPASELKSARKHLRQYFADAPDLQGAFIAFCERVLLSNRYLAGQASRYVPNPSLWLNRAYAFGFTGTRAAHERMHERRKEIKGYQEGITATASHYWRYITAASPKAFTDCRKKLHALREYGLLQIFYNAIIYLNFLEQ